MLKILDTLAEHLTDKNVQDTFKALAGLSSSLKYQASLQDILDEHEIAYVPDFKDTIRARIVDNVNTEMENFIYVDAEDLRYLNQHSFSYVDTNDVQTPLTTQDVQSVIKDLKQSFIEV